MTPDLAKQALEALEACTTEEGPTQDELNSARAVVAALRSFRESDGWLPIETAPKEQELLVGRYVNGEWRVCQSGYYFDSGNEMEGEPSCWYWHCDWDNGGVTDDEGPTHWMLLPPAPTKESP